jgi:hypothetical protein
MPPPASAWVGNVRRTLRKRLFLAESKVRLFEEKYGVALSELDADGLPDDASHEMHEDFIMWHHWVDARDSLKKSILSLEGIVQEGLYLQTGDLPHALS